MSMSGKIKLNYNETFATTHSRDYYRGSSFHFSGKWMQGAHYLSDDYNIDFVVHDQVLLACAKSHLSTLENEPKDFIKDESGTITGIASVYWDFILSGISGASPGIKIVDNYWYICENTKEPEEEQVWTNTGVKAKMEFSDLTPDEIEILQKPAQDFVDNFFTETVVQEKGQNTNKVMSQKAVTDAFTQEINRSNNAYISKDMFALNTTEYWNNNDFVPNKGMIIVYTDYENVEKDGQIVEVPGIKIGSGNGYLSDLAFVGEKERDDLWEHIHNTLIHVTEDEKNFWNNKLNVDDSQEVLDNVLIFNRN